MSHIETALKERIKELTCLYEISSIIVNADIESIEDTLKAITYSLKKAFQFPKETHIAILLDSIHVGTTQALEKNIVLVSDISVFNKLAGTISAHLDHSKFTTEDFLKEEQLLLNSIALKLGNLLERIEIRRNEISLKRQMEHADRLNILGEITAGIAHELNTPLANILGFSELLKDGLGNDNKNSADLDKIIQNVIFSREVVKKLMFFACEMPQKMEMLNIVPSIKGALDLLNTTFKKHDVKYIVKIEEEALWLRADTIQLTQILFNLIINAIYFSPKNGIVTITALQTDKDIVLKVSDEGSGLSTEALEKVFQPFFSTKPTGDGSGLGLSVVHGIVSSHKGTIIAENNSLKGATFTVALPK
ncbi:HAMP domain-containing sensor histidine kinase [Mariniflexile litorale]|uniref:histidine kinase n=1 Tax=Mariniflexile litorale TaxID=3045158 RepID=A0AAU7EDC1_9FLAO|nr:HAMP domain-containing sensor histidine kinase [Mariniflexile sp. KMM 9835]MDQ8213456.1 HAMP domain-containing sensor histidine kinase [Mariniflexile sp. KMM 9835]